MRNGPSAKKKKLTIRQMKKNSYNFEKKISMVVKKIVQSWYFFKMRVYYFFLPVSSRKKRLSVRLQKSTKTHLTDKKPQK